jgi:hypothetical protein
VITVRIQILTRQNSGLSGEYQQRHTFLLGDQIRRSKRDRTLEKFKGRGEDGGIKVVHTDVTGPVSSRRRNEERLETRGLRTRVTGC